MNRSKESYPKCSLLKNNPKQQRSTAPLPALATEDSPSRRMRSFATSTEETAIHDISFHSDPGQDEIKYSDNESEHTNNTDDAEEDHGDGEDDDEYEDTHDEEENFDSTSNKCYVMKNVSQHKYVCWFPVEYDDYRSLFGGCSCGVPNTTMDYHATIWQLL